MVALCVLLVSASAHGSEPADREGVAASVAVDLSRAERRLAESRRRYEARRERLEALLADPRWASADHRLELVVVANRALEAMDQEQRTTESLEAAIRAFSPRG